MSWVLGKGCAVRATQSGAPYYRVHGLNSPGPLFVQSVNPHRQEIFGAKSGFGNKHKYYAFGHGHGNISVNVEMFLGSNVENRLENVVNGFYESNRAYTRKRPVIVTTRDGSRYVFFLTGVQGTGTDPDRNKVMMALTGVLIDV